ncbi:MAG: hypothetical protein WCG50_11160 [Rhodoferax sp.]|uniref:hypothetical protein n=1 Tax=Rhodoferax sp. TaxID=50421 RepID=UPI003015ABE1
MRTPIEGELLTAANGAVYTVTSVILDDNIYIVQFIAGSDVHDMKALEFNKTDIEFEDLCEREGIVLL